MSKRIFCIATIVPVLLLSGSLLLLVFAVNLLINLVFWPITGHSINPFATKFAKVENVMEWYWNCFGV